jgi:hypothetical protein
MISIKHLRRDLLNKLEIIMDGIKIVDAVVAGDKEAFMSAFNAALSSRVTDALEIKKVEVASTLITPEEATDEVTGSESEVDGSESSDGDDSASEDIEPDDFE